MFHGAPIDAGRSKPNESFGVGDHQNVCHVHSLISLPVTCMATSSGTIMTKNTSVTASAMARHESTMVTASEALRNGISAITLASIGAEAILSAELEIRGSVS